MKHTFAFAQLMRMCKNNMQIVETDDTLLPHHIKLKRKFTKFYHLVLRFRYCPTLPHTWPMLSNILDTSIFAAGLRLLFFLFNSRHFLHSSFSPAALAYCSGYPHSLYIVCLVSPLILQHSWIFYMKCHGSCSLKMYKYQVFQ